MELINTPADQIFETVADYEKAKGNFKTLKSDIEVFEKALIEQAGEGKRDFVFPDGILVIPEKERSGDSPAYKAMFEAIKERINDGSIWTDSKDDVRLWLENLWNDKRGNKYKSRKPKIKKEIASKSKRKAKKMASAS